MPFGNQELTDTGVSYLTQAQLGEQLRITRMQVGKGVAANLPDDLWPLTDLIDPVMDIPIIASNYVSPDTLRVTGQLSSLDVPSGGGFELNEVGIMAECGVLIEALYSVDNTGGNGDFVPDIDAPAPVVQVIDLYIKISRATNITIAVSPAGTYEATNRGDPLLGPGPYIEKVGDILHFKRFVAGDGIEIEDDLLVPPETITIGLKKLIVDLDLYVTENHPDKPVDGLGFPAIQNALDHLTNIFIPPERMATIYVQAGEHIIATPILVTHPQSNRIRIIGEVGITHNIISANQPTGGPSNYSIVLTLDSAADIEVGDIVLIPNALGTWPENTTINGGCHVTTVAGNNITIQVVFNGTYTNFAITGGIVIPLKTRLKCAPDIIALGIYGSGLLLLRNFAIISDPAAQGLTAIHCGIATVIALDTISVDYFSDIGIETARHSYVHGNRISVLKCGVGFYSVDTIMNLVDSIASYCTTGINIAYGRMSITGIASLINNNTGFQLGEASLAIVSGTTSCFWSNTGLAAQSQSVIGISSTGTMFDLRMFNILDISLYMASIIVLATESTMYYATANISPGFSMMDGCYLPPSSV